MDTIPVPLWSIGVVLIIAGPFVVQRVADLWAAAVERRTEDALSAMTARTGSSSVDERADEPDDDARPDALTQHDSAEGREERRERKEH